MFELHKFESSEALLAFVKERSDDMEKAIIPMSTTLHFNPNDGGPAKIINNAGMVLNLINGMRHVLTKQDAESVLNDGILTRMKIPIELMAPKT